MPFVSVGMRTILTTLFFAVAFVAACKKNNSYVTLSYKQTQCSDPWGTSQNDSITIKGFKHYADSTKLYATNIYITKDGDPAACLACACPTGRFINVTTLKNDSMIAKYKRLGFY
jgi:hypothetical protein